MILRIILVLAVALLLLLGVLVAQMLPPGAMAIVVGYLLCALTAVVPLMAFGAMAWATREREWQRQERERQRQEWKLRRPQIIMHNPTFHVMQLPAGMSWPALSESEEMLPARVRDGRR